jgi:uncharacterized protein (TIGR03437 family)
VWTSGLGIVVCILSLLPPALAQLIPSGTAIPHTTLPPVVFIDGYQVTCPATFSGTFGIADQVLQSNGEVSLFFSTCSLPPTASIEDLAAAFATFLSGLSYTDGQPVDQVDVVTHSMGGLVLRCYLSGKQNAAGMFEPPAATHVRKAVLLASPNFGTGIASLLGITYQVNEMASGSAFLFGLDTWNQGTDDLRGIDAVAAAGNAGSGGTGNPAGFDDGVITLTSASLQFYMPGRTRVIPYCHIDSSGVIAVFDLCPANAPGIADIESAAHDSAQIITSFLGGTSAWQSVGTAAEDNSFLSVDGGLIVAALAPDALTSVSISGAVAVVSGSSTTLSISSDGLAFADLVPAGLVTLNLTAPSLPHGFFLLNGNLTLPAGGTEPYTVTEGPHVTRAFPAAAANFPLVLAPRMFIAIYGANLADQTAEATGATFPTQLADAQVMANGSPIPLYYVSATQIDAVLPDSVSGLTELTVQNSMGKYTVNIYVEAAAPAIFTQDASGSGPAAALNASNQTLVTADNPLKAGDAVELYATGLGLTTLSNGLNEAIQQPTVTVAGVSCPVTFAGAAPGYIGLDQVNCTIPAGIAATGSAPVVVTSGTQTSNTATLAIN